MRALDTDVCAKHTEICACLRIPLSLHEWHVNWNLNVNTQNKCIVEDYLSNTNSDAAAAGLFFNENEKFRCK